MDRTTMLDTFVSASPFSNDPSYRKKLRFIVGQVEGYAMRQNKAMRDVPIDQGYGAVSVVPSDFGLLG